MKEAILTSSSTSKTLIGVLEQEIQNPNIYD